MTKVLGRADVLGKTDEDKPYAKLYLLESGASFEFEAEASASLPGGLYKINVTEAEALVAGACGKPAKAQITHPDHTVTAEEIWLGCRMAGNAFRIGKKLTGPIGGMTMVRYN